MQEWPSSVQGLLLASGKTSLRALLILHLTENAALGAVGTENQAKNHPEK